MGPSMGPSADLSTQDSLEEGPPMDPPMDPPKDPPKGPPKGPPKDPPKDSSKGSPGLVSDCGPKEASVETSTINISPLGPCGEPTGLDALGRGLTEHRSRAAKRASGDCARGLSACRLCALTREILRSRANSPSDIVASLGVPWAACSAKSGVLTLSVSPSSESSLPDASSHPSTGGSGRSGGSDRSDEASSCSISVS